ncbi:hypothetical protein Tcan_17474 [Toxocara canis]|uniref:Uncharacterized protein n=1 Tax=Toxocara canis TaxID=6265 RepID=A0A0B2VQ93_TOXCA|nr:hypothetical protein Tcan_17474 [Toxocara canis]
MFGVRALPRCTVISSLIFFTRALLITSMKSPRNDASDLEYGSVYCPSLSDAISTCKPGTRFYYYYCCGDMEFYCCFAFETWFVVVLSCAAFIATVCIGYVVVRCICCRRVDTRDDYSDG